MGNGVFFRATAVCFACFFLLSIEGYTQRSEVSYLDSVRARYETYTSLSSPEKLYLHTDKELYSVGESVWFRGYLTNASTEAELPQSSFIYVELIHADTLVCRVKIKQDAEGFSGYIPLSGKLDGGQYTLRAYSRWMADVSPEYLFHKQLTVAKGPQQPEKPVNSSPTALAELTFYPESGRYLAEETATVAFKANDLQGRGVVVSGGIYRSDGSLATAFTTQHSGMGVFTFRPQKGERYYAVANDSGQNTLKAALPELSLSGATISLIKRKDRVHIRGIVSPDLQNSGLFLMLHDKDRIIHTEPLAASGVKLSLLKEELPQGINHLKVVDGSGRIYAERMFFVYPPAYTATLATNKTEYGRREKVESELVITDAKGKPLEGSFSLSVTDYFLIPHDVSQENITSYMLLSSELKGTIEHPGYYFNQAISQNEREGAMDLLMMVQGWRYYDVEGIFMGKVAQQAKEREYGQSISGKAHSSLFRKAKGATLNVVAPSISLFLSEELTGDGRFEVLDLDFPDSTSFFFYASKNEAENGLMVELMKEGFPEQTAYRPTATSESIAAITDEFSDITRWASLENGEEEVLEEAVVRSSYTRTPRHNPSPYGQWFRDDQIKERKDLEDYDAMTVKSYLQIFYPSMVQGMPTHASGGGSPTVYIDQVRVNSAITGSLLGDLEYMPLADVEVMVVLKSWDPSLAMYPSSFGGVIMITTRQGTASYDNSTSNTITYTPLGWQKPKNFYSPNYELQQKNRAANDWRTTLLWEPFLTFDKNGKATVSFFTSDRTTRFRFTVEGVTVNGAYISSSMVLE